MKLNENFKDLMAPIRYVDSKIHRTYQKLGNWFEKKGVKRDYVCNALDLGILVSLGLPHDYSTQPRIFTEVFENNPVKASTLLGIGISYPNLLVHDIAYNLKLLSNKYLSYALDSSKAEDKFNYISKKIQKVARIPLFGLGLHALYDYIAQDPNNFYGNPLVCAIAFTALASSMYLKDNNPKLLEKQPMYKDALDLAKKLGNKALQPVPQTIPVHADNYSLEDKI